MDWDECMDLLKKCRKRLPTTEVESVLRLAGLDDGLHLGECEQFERDARIYPAMEAAALSHSYLSEDTASKLSRHIAEEMDLIEGPTYCQVCGTRNKDDFNTEKTTLACEACYDEVGPPRKCARCGVSSYRGDECGMIVWTELAAQEGACSQEEVGKRYDTCGKSVSYRAAFTRNWVAITGTEYICDRCAENL